MPWSFSTGEQVTVKTLFSVGSLTKPMVATVITFLAQGGRLSLDDPVAAHAPELRSSRWAQRSRRCETFWRNRSGLPLRVGLEFDFDGRRDEGGDARVPSERFWSYTNVGWCLLGRVIESVTDGAWEDAMRLHLLEGAKMSATTFATDAVTGDEVTEEEWSRVFAAFSPHLPDEEREARTP